MNIFFIFTEFSSQYGDNLVHGQGQKSGSECRACHANFHGRECRACLANSKGNGRSQDCLSCLENGYHGNPSNRRFCLECHHVSSGKYVPIWNQGWFQIASTHPGRKCPACAANANGLQCRECLATANGQPPSAENPPGKYVPFWK